MKKPVFLLGLCTLFLLFACQMETRSNNSYWRNERTGEWMVGLVDEKMIYDTRIWDITELVNNEEYDILTAECGNQQLTVQIGHEAKGRRTFIFGQDTVVCSRIGGETLPDYPTPDTTTWTDNHYQKGDSVTIIGWIKDRRHQHSYEQQIVEARLRSYLTGHYIKYQTIPDSLGRFTLRFPIENTTFVEGYYLPNLVVAPNLTYLVMQDYDEHKTLVMGADARLQNEMLAVPFKPTLQNREVLRELDTPMAIADTLQRRTSAKMAELEDLLLQHPTLSARYGEFQRSTIHSTLGYIAIMSAFRFQDSLATFETFLLRINEEYWNKLPQPYMVCGEYFHEFQSSYHSAMMHIVQRKASQDPVLWQQYYSERSVLEAGVNKGLFRLTTGDWDEVDRFDKQYRDSAWSVEEAALNHSGFMQHVWTQIDSTQYRIFRELYWDCRYYRIMLSALREYGFNQEYRDIFLCGSLWNNINWYQRPLGKYVIAFADSIQMPAARDIVYEIQQRYTNLNRVSMKRAQANKVSPQWQQGEQILSQLIAPYRGKYILVDVWGTWCGPCIANLEKSQQEYERLKEYDMIFMYLASNSKDEDCQRIIDEYNVKGPNVVHHNLPKGQQNLVEFYLGVSGYPTYKLIDPDGDILDVRADPDDLNVLDNLMKQLIRE